MQKLIGYYNYTVILTYLGLCSGIVGIIQTAVHNKPSVGVICLLLSGLCDAFDGKVAQTKKRNDDEKAFGIQIDSLSDIVCFGVLPAVICYASGAHTVIGIAAIVAYVLCGLIRLAYYNVTEIARQQREASPRTEYLGLPITVSAIVIPAVFLISEILMHDVKEYIGWLFSFVAVVLAAAFIIPFRIKKLMKVGLMVIVAVGFALAVLLLMISFA